METITEEATQDMSHSKVLTPSNQVSKSPGGALTERQKQQQLEPIQEVQLTYKYPIESGQNTVDNSSYTPPNNVEASNIHQQ